VPLGVGVSLFPPTTSGASRRSSPPWRRRDRSWS